MDSGERERKKIGTLRASTEYNKLGKSRIDSIKPLLYNDWATKENCHLGIIVKYNKNVFQEY